MEVKKMPLFDPTFYNHEQQESQPMYEPTDPELMGVTAWIIFIAVASCVAIGLYVAYGVIK